MFFRDRMLSINKREGDERPTVFLPGRKHGQLIESRRLIHNFRHGGARHIARTQLQELERQTSMMPEMRRLRRNQRLRNFHQLFNELFGPVAESQLDSLVSPEKIRDYRESASLHLREQKSRPAATNHAAMNLG